MKHSITILMVALMAISTSCNPDEEDTNSGNGSNGGNGGGNNTGNAASYPEIVNLLEGNWYGSSIKYADGSILDNSGTAGVGYITFSSTPQGQDDFGVFEDWFLEAYFPILSNQQVVTTYNWSITNLDQSWSGVGGYYLLPQIGSYPYAQGLPNSLGKYCIVKLSTPFYDVQTPLINYAISGGLDITNLDINASFIGAAEAAFSRIKSLSANSLVLVQDIGGTYLEFTFIKQ